MAREDVQIEKKLKEKQVEEMKSTALQLVWNKQGKRIDSSRRR